MIPENINESHILSAITELKNNGAAKNRASKKFSIEYEKDLYPPKLVISIANRYANGVELDPSSFSGGRESNEFLKSRGYKIVTRTGAVPAKTKGVSKHARKSENEKQHNERCPSCKDNILALLKELYSDAFRNYDFGWSNRPELLANSTYYNIILSIFEDLKSYRGYSDFIRSDKLSPCDYFIPTPGFILEFDESQHFTMPRKLVLERYPDAMDLGFNKKKWELLCKEINSKDNDPPFRDEQRAWFDTVRDFMPRVRGLKPTVRLYSKDYSWCSLNPKDLSGLARFKNFLVDVEPVKAVVARNDPNPIFARIILAQNWGGKPEQSRRALELMLDAWPEGKATKFIVTCGGFAQFTWPKELTSNTVGDNLFPNPSAMENLAGLAQATAKQVLDGGLLGRLGKVADYMTLGIDSHKEKISTVKNKIPELHVEMVILVDLKSGQMQWTGKSYPTSGQQEGLIRVADPKRHFFEIPGYGKIMILGCHDLSIFNPRSINAKGWRREVNDEFKRLASEEKPRVVLHHPHTADSDRTWLMAWNTLRKMLPSVVCYAGAGKYFETQGARSRLEEVLDKTRLGETIDFILL